MVKSETTIRRELKAVKIAQDRLSRNDLPATFELRVHQLVAIEATLKWALGQINKPFPQRLNGGPCWSILQPACQRPLAYILDTEGNEANAKAGLMERRRDKRRA